MEEGIPDREGDLTELLVLPPKLLRVTCIIRHKGSNTESAYSVVSLVRTSR